MEMAPTSSLPCTQPSASSVGTASAPLTIVKGTKTEPPRVLEISSLPLALEPGSTETEPMVTILPLAKKRAPTRQTQSHDKCVCDIVIITLLIVREKPSSRHEECC